MYEFLFQTNQIHHLSPGAGLLTSTVWVGFFLCPSLCVCAGVGPTNFHLALAWWDRPGRATLLRNSTGSKSGSPILRHTHLLPLFPWKYFNQSLVLWMHMKMMQPNELQELLITCILYKIQLSSWVWCWMYQILIHPCSGNTWYHFKLTSDVVPRSCAKECHLKSVELSSLLLWVGRFGISCFVFARFSSWNLAFFCLEDVKTASEIWNPAHSFCLWLGFIPSWELRYPMPRHCWRWFFFPGWDMLVPWRVYMSGCAGFLAINNVRWQPHPAAVEGYPWYVFGTMSTWSII